MQAAVEMPTMQAAEAAPMQEQAPGTVKEIRIIPAEAGAQPGTWISARHSPPTFPLAADAGGILFHRLTGMRWQKGQNLSSRPAATSGTVITVRTTAAGAAGSWIIQQDACSLAEAEAQVTRKTVAAETAETAEDWFTS
jgi:hypothetical protein